MAGPLLLAINAGSSSLKISLFALIKTQDDGDEPVSLILTSSISAISSPPAKFAFQVVSNPRSEIKEQVETIKDHASAFAHFLACLEHNASIDKNRIVNVCHRVVHGGEFSDPILISEDTYHHIEDLSDLAPLHNGGALSVIKACISALPNAKSIAFFDTAFHRSIPPHISTYPIDQTIARAKGLKKYGFHGLSYAFILRAVSKFLNKTPETLNLIVLHLGSGASACAIRAGRSLDTSMGLTPLNGLPGATRAGAIDPSLIFHYTNTAGRISHAQGMTAPLHVTEAEDILNTKAGWKALTGTTDFGLITTRAFAAPASTEINSDDPNPDRLAFDLFVDRILDFVGAYFVKLGGHVDALVFAGGIGERGAAVREVVGRAVRCLGFAEVDPGKNEQVGVEGQGKVVDIGVDVDEGRKILVCKTDEQLEMARECALDGRFWESAAVQQAQT